jgi:hypothetical protein
LNKYKHSDFARCDFGIFLKIITCGHPSQCNCATPAKCENNAGFSGETVIPVRSICPSLPVTLLNTIAHLLFFIPKRFIMKKNELRLLFITVIVLTGSFYVLAQAYISTRNLVPVVVRTTQAGHDYLWVDGQWGPNRNAYWFTGGPCELPLYPGYRSRRAHWKLYGVDGEIWVAGRWRR